jgi:hypothetical protein
MPDETHTAVEKWIGIWRYIISFLVGVIVASYVVGGARQKIADVGRWKEQTAPRIERMDSQGTLSFELFHKEYDRTQHRQEETLKELDKRLREVERKP